MYDLRRYTVPMALACFAALLCAAPPANPRNDAWEVIGPGGGGAMFHPTISPRDPNVVFVNCDMGGAYLSKDGGRSWRMFNLRGAAAYFVFDPSDPNTMYVRTIGLWRSSDAGATWALIHPRPKAIRTFTLSDDEAEPGLEMGWDEGSINALAVDPTDSRVLYALMRQDNQEQLARSTNQGGGWKTVTNKLPAQPRALYIDPDSPPGERTVYIVGASQVAVLEGNRVRLGAAAPKAFVDISAGFPGGGAKAVIYGATVNEVFVSRDGGGTWDRRTPGGELRAVATALHHPAVAYVSFGGKAKPEGESFGVARSEDFGATWRDLWSESAAKSPGVDDGWLSERFGPDWGENPVHMAVAADQPEICYATDQGRTLRTVDGGATWTAAYARRVAGGGFATTGLDVTTSYGVHFDPFDLRHMFIGYTDIGLFGSDDGGASWYSATVNGVPREWRNTTYWVEFDPAVRGRVWAVMSGAHDLPRDKMWREGPVSRFRGGVVRSDDGGRTWRAMSNGLPTTAATHILLDRRSRPEARVLYVAGFGKGVFRSSDGGESWEARNGGLPAHEPFAWRLAQDRNGVLYVVIARRAHGGEIGTERDGGVYRSGNEGRDWERLTLPPGVNGPSGLAIDPDDPGRLYLAAWRRKTNDDKPGGGIYLSTDAGATWKQMLKRDQYVYDITIDGRNQSLYAAGFEGSAWRSTDRGLTWQRIRGYNFNAGHRVVLDPNDASKIFITTYGGGVWHGPAAGDPNAAEDIVTPLLAYPR